MGQDLSAVAATVNKVTAVAIVVNSPASKEAAQTNLTEVRTAVKQLDQVARALKRPHQDEIDKINKDVKALKARLDERDSALVAALLTYKRACDEATRIAQQKALDKYEKKVATTEAKAIAEGKPMPLVAPPPVIAQTARTEQVGDSIQTVRKTKAWRLPTAVTMRHPEADADTLTAQQAQDYGLPIPLEYFVLDTARIGRVIRSGGKIPGIEDYTAEGISVRGGA